MAVQQGAGRSRPRVRPRAGTPFAKCAMAERSRPHSPRRQVLEEGRQLCDAACRRSPLTSTLCGFGTRVRQLVHESGSRGYAPRLVGPTRWARSLP